MSNEEFDLEDARDATGEIDMEAEEAIAALERGIGPREAKDAINNLQSSTHQLVQYAEAVNDAVDTLTGGSYSEGIEGVLEGADDAYEHLNVVRDRTGVIERALEGKGGSDGTLTIDGEEFEVSLTPIETDNDGGESPPPFGEWLAAVMNEKGLDRAYIYENSLVSGGRVGEILEGDEPRGDEAPSIIKLLVEDGQLEDESRIETVKERYW